MGFCKCGRMLVERHYYHVKTLPSGLQLVGNLWEIKIVCPVSGKPADQCDFKLRV